MAPSARVQTVSKDDESRPETPPNRVPDPPNNRYGDDLTRDALGARVFRQTTTYAGLRTIASLSTLVSYAFLVRILDRHEIGVFEVGMAYVGFGFVIGEGGLAAALVRKREEVTLHEYRVVFATQLIATSLLALGYLATAEWIGRTNHFNTEETTVLRFLAPILLLRALPVVPRARMQRALRFDLVGQVELFSTLARNITAVVAALTFGGPWALVAAALAQAMVAAVVSYSLSPGWVGLAFRFRTFRGLIAFGSQVQGTNLLHYVRENIVVAVLGPALGPSAVALYRFAYTYARIPSDAIGSLARVHFRMYAMCDPGSPQLASAIRTALRASNLVGALILGVTTASAYWTIPWIYGEKWISAIPIVWGLLPHVLADIAMSQMVAMAQGQGKPSRAIVFYTVWSVATWVCCLIAVGLGDDLAWVGLGQSAATVLAAGVAMTWVNRQAKSNIAAALLRPAIIVASGLTAVYVLPTESWAAWQRALTGVVTFLSVAGLMATLIDRPAIVVDLKGAIYALRRKKT